MATPPLRAGIVGAGSAGLAAAAFLARAGWEVTVFEKVASLLPVGAGLLLQPTGASVLGELGVRAVAETGGAHILDLDGRNGYDMPVVNVKYAALDAASHGIGIHRATLSSALHAAVTEARSVSPLGYGSVSFALGHEIESVSFGSSATPAVIRGPRGTPLGEFDMAIISSGASAETIAPPGIVDFTRRYPWGAMWALLEDPGETFGTSLVQAYRKTHTMLGFMPTGRTIHYLAGGAGSVDPVDQTSEESNTPTTGLAGGGSSSDSLEPTGSPLVSLFYSLRAADRMAFEDDVSLDEFKARVLKLQPRAEAVLESLTSKDQLTWARYSDVKLSSFHVGRTVFMGDAAHATSPQLGQGANFALIDASGLNYVLKTALHALDGDERKLRTRLPAILGEYTALRRPHIHFYQAMSRMMTPLFQSRLSPLAPVRDLTMGLGGQIWPFSAFATRLLTGYQRTLLTTMPFSATNPYLWSDHPRRSHIANVARKVE